MVFRLSSTTNLVGINQIIFKGIREQVQLLNMIVFSQGGNVFSFFLLSSMVFSMVSTELGVKRPKCAVFPICRKKKIN